MMPNHIDTLETSCSHPGFYPRRTTLQIEPFDLPPLRLAQLRQMREQQAAFDKAFPPIRQPGRDVLILSWEEIERQFLDLSPPWDRQNAAWRIRQACQMSAWETPEKTMRWLFVLSHASPGLDAAEPRSGTGNSLPMP